MRTKPINLLTDLQKLITDLLQHVPEPKHRELGSRVSALNEECERFKQDGRGGHWKSYRDNQCFHVDVRGKGSYEVRGVEKMAADLGWKISTLRSKLATNLGQIHVERTRPGEEPEILTVTRLKRNSE